MSDTTLTRVEQLVDQLSFTDQLSLVEYLAQRLRQATLQKQPQDLYGVWRGRFPDDFDVESALGDIRRRWEREWTQVTAR